MVSAWMLWSAYALGTRAELWFWHGFSGQRMLSKKHNLAAYAGGRAKVLENPTAEYAPWTNYHL